MKTKLLMALFALMLGFGVVGGTVAHAADTNVDEPDGANNNVDDGGL